MATYAAVVSLMNTMDAVMNDPRLSSCFDKQQIQSLGENLDFLLQFIENYNFNSLGRDDGEQSLERRITSAAHRAEDVIESHIVTQIHAGVLEDASASSIDLHQIMHDIDEIKEEVVKVAEKMVSNNLQKPKNSPQPLPTGKMTMIGFDDHLIHLLDRLTGYESGRQVIPIVGMGGAGKTTLTKNSYEHLLTVQRFDARAWVSISQSYDVKNILEQLLSTLGQSTYGNNEDELIMKLHKYFYGRRYLVVLDDMWSITAWEKLQFCFPENYNGSRIIVTTRLLEVANAFGSSSEVRVGLLDDNKSWDLFCDRAFAQQSCPEGLEEIGKAIVKKCKGLPLAIAVIGALLGKSSQAREHWKNIAENMSSILSSSDDILDILCLSYNHLPAHLKPCFLYLGTFKEDYEVSVSELVKLWIAEGFIKPNKDEMLEEVAEGYMYDLLERSLILVDSLGWNEKFSRFRIHDLVRDLCLREAYKEKFFFVISTMVDEVEAERCIVYPFQEYSTRLRSTAARSIILNTHYPPQLLIGSTILLRVCAAKSLIFHAKDEFLSCLQNVNMRFISCKISGLGVPSVLHRSIFLLWNLQTLIIKNPDMTFEAPVEIWKMRQLRHVEFYVITLPEPPLSEEEDEFVVLHNLQTLEEVVDLRCSEEVCKRIPNIKSLEVYLSENSNEYCLQNVGRLNKLESLSLNFSIKPILGDLLQNLTLSTSLKKLSLINCNLDWNDLGIIGSLPNLELLKISQYPSGTDIVWKCVEGQFLALKHLLIGGCHINSWIVESCHFPVLDTLTLNFVTLDGGIPLGIGKITTLKKIYVRSRDSTALSISAMKLLKEQEDLGNDLLQLQLQFHKKKIAEKFLEEVEKEGLTCTNFTLCVISNV